MSEIDRVYKMHPFTLLILLLLFRHYQCTDAESSTYSQEEFKCSLPDVTSVDSNLDITRFRSDFSKISEVKFPGLIGPLNERLICKIKCIDGNWVGPLCSSTPDGRFQPILRECLYRHDHTLLAISFKNSSIEKDTSFPHGSELVARCRHFGLYKLKGEGRLRCENGEWAPAFPECVPTTLVTNFTGDAPPTLQYRISSGSGVVGWAGDLLLYPESAVQLDCVTPRALGDPDWSWHAPAHHSAAWSSEEGEVDTVYRLTLNKLPARYSDQLTCTAPGGHTHTVLLRVVNVSCAPVEASSAQVQVYSQGSRLGQTQHFSCRAGFHLQGASVLTCMPDGRWSGAVPSCAETQCPAFEALDPQLSVVEFNASWGGGALFRCAWGYRLQGAPGLECERDGAWSGSAPRCSPIYCPEPPVPDNGQLLTEASSKHGKYVVGDLVIYSCLQDFQIHGEPSIVCTENGFWSHPPPFCLPPSEIRKPDTIYVDNTTLVHVDE